LKKGVVVALLALAWSPAAAARSESPSQLVRRGITHALRQHWLKPPDAAR